MKHILIKSMLKGIRTDSGVKDISNTVLNIAKTLQDKQKVRVSTELYLSENAIDNGGIMLTTNQLDNIPLNQDVFKEQVIHLVCDTLKSKGYDVIFDLIERSAIFL